MGRETATGTATVTGKTSWYLWTYRGCATPSIGWPKKDGHSPGDRDYMGDINRPSSRICAVTIPTTTCCARRGCYICTSTFSSTAAPTIVCPFICTAASTCGYSSEAPANTSGAAETRAAQDRCKTSTNEEAAGRLSFHWLSREYQWAATRLCG